MCSVVEVLKARESVYHAPLGWSPLQLVAALVATFPSVDYRARPPGDASGSRVHPAQAPGPGLCADWSIRRFVRTARRYRTVQIRAGQQLITAADPLPADLQAALGEIHQARRGH